MNRQNNSYLAFNTTVMVAVLLIQATKFFDTVCRLRANKKCRTSFGLLCPANILSIYMSTSAGGLCSGKGAGKYRGL